MSRPRNQFHWPENATERAIRIVILRWHIAGCLQLLEV